MNRLIAAALVTVTAFTSLVGTAAVADSRDRDRGRDERSWSDGRHDHRDHGRRDDRRHADHRYYSDRYYDGHYDGRYKVVRYYPPKNYRHHRWYRGAYLPAAYYAPRYVVHNYSTYRLRPPPRGYHWVRVDNDVILAAIATGLVANVVSDIFY
jgi:Ni/Co efflux regulator RcnB